MTAPVLVDATRFSRSPQDTEAPIWWGFAAMILIESTVFASLVTSYFYLRFGATAWPPGGIDPPELLLPTVNTGILILSSGVLHWADTGIRADNRKRLSIGMTLAGALAVLFLVLKVIEYSDSAYHWDDHAYGSIVWAIVGFHSAHVLVLVLKTLVVTTLAWQGRFSHERRTGVTVNGLYWHFVTAIWLPLYVVLYWVPRL